MFLFFFFKCPRIAARIIITITTKALKKKNYHNKYIYLKKKKITPALRGGGGGSCTGDGGGTGVDSQFFCCCSHLYETRRQGNQTPSNCPFLRHPAAPICCPFAYIIYLNKKTRRRLSSAVLHTIAFLLGRSALLRCFLSTGVKDLLERRAPKK